MKVVGVVSSLGVKPGLYGRKGVDEERVSESWNRETTVIAASAHQASTVRRNQPGVGQENPRAAGAAAAAGAWVAGGALFGLLFPSVLMAGPVYYLYKNWGKLFGSTAPPAPIKRISGAHMPSANQSTAILPSSAIIVPAALLAKDYRDYDDKVFHGLFASAAELETLMTQEGGNSELHIVDQGTANALFEHPGRGTFSRGLHLPHPKDAFVLVPMKDWDKRIKEEILYEWIRVFEALGAKNIVIGDYTNVKGGAKVAHSNPAGGVEAQMRAEYGSSLVEVSTFEKGGFDPIRATENRRWLGDHPAITAIVEGRVSGQQASWRRTVEVDLACGVSVEVLALAAPSLTKVETDVKFRRKFDLYVEFHPKK
jgi:hypothetical protein